MSLAVALTQLRARRQELDEEIGRVDRAIQVLAELDSPATPPKGRGAPRAPAAPKQRSKAATGGACSRCHKPGHNARTCGAKATGKPASDDEERGAVATAELFDDHEVEREAAAERAAERQRKLDAGLIREDPNEGERKQSARRARGIAAVKFKQAAERQLTPLSQKQLRNTGKGRWVDLVAGERKLARCRLCRVGVLAVEAQMQGHLDRAHGGQGDFEEAAA